jgi:hypothetical protein
MESHISNPKPAVHFGKGLAYELRNKSAAQRAVIAAEDGDGDLYIYQPTNTQRASVYKVSPVTLAAARALPPVERDRVKRGLRPLIEPQDRLNAAISDDDVVRVLNEIGCDRVWRVLDMVTMPTPVAAE